MWHPAFVFSLRGGTVVHSHVEVFRFRVSRRCFLSTDLLPSLCGLGCEDFCPFLPESILQIQILWQDSLCTADLSKLECRQADRDRAAARPAQTCLGGDMGLLTGVGLLPNRLWLPLSNDKESNKASLDVFSSVSPAAPSETGSLGGKKTSEHFSMSLLRRPQLFCSNDPTHSTQIFFI